MLSTISPFVASNPMIGNPFPSFENGFPPWDCLEFFQNITPTDPKSPNPAGSGLHYGSDEPNMSKKTPANSNSGSDDPTRSTQLPNQSAESETVSVIDERRRRRMISNRESARRSRMRKQKQLENLRNKVNRLRVENRELTNRMRFVLYHSHSMRTENDRLRSEHIMLQRKLSDIRQFLMVRQHQQFTSAWPCNNIITATEQIPSLITS